MTGRIHRAPSAGCTMMREAHRPVAGYLRSLLVGGSVTGLAR
jgi:hypothetical protein